MRKRIVTTALAFDVTVRNTASGKCLAPQGESTADGVAVVQVTCNGSAFQRWDFIDRGDHVFQIRNAVSRKCMDVWGRNNNETPVVQWPCAGTSNQRFQAGRNLPDFVTLKSRVAGTKTHCLDVPGGQDTEGLAMQIWSCNGTASQAFGVFPV